MAVACREAGIKTVAVTAGEICEEPRADFFGAMDAANVDLKGFTERFYREVCAGHLQPVLDTLEYLKTQTSVWFEITTLLIPGENDADDDLDQLTRWVVERPGPDVPLHFTAFHPDFRMLDLPPTPLATLRRAREIAIGNGVRYAYTGNVIDPAGSRTTCHGCRATLVERDGYRVTSWNLTDDGLCCDCGTRCAGVFDGPPGDWGSRRLSVRLRDYRCEETCP